MNRIDVDDIYWDCAYHPVLCTQSIRVTRHLRTVDYDIAGFSLFDGSQPRSCSVKHCGVIALSYEQIQWLILRRDRWLAAEGQWRNGDVDAYKELLKEWDEYTWSERVE